MSLLKGCILNHVLFHSSGSHKVSLSSWYHDRGWAKISNMTFSNGKLIVNQDGFYFLYANICFRHHETSGDLATEYLQLMVYVTKTSIKIPSSHTLMKGGSTKYWSGNSEFHFYSINVGGFFKLRSGEEISIEVSNPSLLDPDQDATYFGAFKVLDIDWVPFYGVLFCISEDVWKIFLNKARKMYIDVRLLRGMTHNDTRRLFPCFWLCSEHVYLQPMGEVGVNCVTV